MKQFFGLCLLGLSMHANAIVEAKSVNQATQMPASKSIRFEGKVKGYQTVDHHFRVKKGQKLSIRLLSKNRFAYFNLYEPKKDEAIFTGMISGERFKGVAKTSGEYRLRVYLVRAAARRNETAQYRLDINQ